VGHTFNWCSLLPATLVADKGVGVTVLHQSAVSQAAAIRRRETSSVELVTEATELRDRFDGALNAIIWKRRRGLSRPRAGSGRCGTNGAVQRPQD
jgi:hypothetical protein